MWPSTSATHFTSVDSFKEGDWIVVIYDQWYPGVIEKIEDGILTTKFLSKTKSGYCLVAPIRPEDTQEIIHEQVLCKIEPPTFKEGGKKMYYITKEQEIFVKNELKNNVINH